MEIPTLLRIAAALAAVGLILCAFAVVSRRRFGTTLLARGDRLVNVVETTPLSPTASLHVVKLGETYHTIALSAGAVSLLTTLEPPVVERFAAARKSAGIRGRNARRTNDARPESAPGDPA
jgi:flagellar biogenesis protein FliO